MPIKRNDFSVKQQRGCRQRTNRGNNPREACGSVIIISTKQRDVRAFFVGKDPDAVVFLLVDHPDSSKGSETSMASMGRTRNGMMFLTLCEMRWINGTFCL